MHKKISLEELCKDNIKKRRKRFIAKVFGIDIPTIIAILCFAGWCLAATISLWINT